MPTLRSKVQPAEADNACGVCHETARRDEALLDALQQAMVVLTAVDDINDPEVRVKRAKASIREVQRLVRNGLDLMQVRHW